MSQRASRPAEPSRARAVLDDESVERLAHRVAELLALRLEPASGPKPQRLLSAAEVAERFGVARAWVYAHASELGAMRLGAGRKPRLRFDAEQAAARLTALGPRPPTSGPAPTARQPRRSAAIAGDPVELLEIRGQPELSSPQHTTDRPGGARTPPATAPKRRPSAR